LKRYEIACALEKNKDDAEVTINHLLNNVEKENPPLISKAKPKPVNNGEWKKNNNSDKDMDLSTKLQLNKLYEQFYWLEVDVLSAIFAFCNKNPKETIKYLYDAFPEPMKALAPSKKEMEEKPKPVVPPSSPKSKSHILKEFEIEQSKMKQLKNEEKFRLVTTKKRDKPKEKCAPKDIKPAISYKDEITYHCELRNTYFRQATLAHMSGNHNLATQYRLQGQEHAAKMKELHLKSIESISSDLFPVIDLHFHNVKEAVEIVKETLEKTSGAKILKIITGKGLHSKDGIARIKPVVESYLDEQGYQYHYLESNPGVIVVKL